MKLVMYCDIVNIKKAPTPKVDAPEKVNVLTDTAYPVAQTG